MPLKSRLLRTALGYRRAPYGVRRGGAAVGGVGEHVDDVRGVAERVRGRLRTVCSAVAERGVSAAHLWVKGVPQVCTVDAVWENLTGYASPPELMAKFTTLLRCGRADDDDLGGR